jgi:hypothetical protein
MSKDEVILDDLISYAACRRDENKQYKVFFESIDNIKRNWKLIYLGFSSLSFAQIKKIDYTIETFSPSLDKINFIKLLNEEGIQTFNIEEISYTFTKLNVRSR